MKFAFLVFLSILSCPLFSQYSTIRISSSEGMTNSSVNCLFEDSENILWIGTWDGLNSYNGRDIKNYRYSKNKENSISHNIVRQIIEQDSSIIWVVTDNGINRFSKRSQQFTCFFDSRSSITMTMMSDKMPLCYIHNEGLYYFNDKNQLFEKIDYNIGSDIDANNTSSLVADSNNNLYVLNNNGILKKYILNNNEGKVKITGSAIIDENKNIRNIIVTKNRLIVNYSSFLKIIDTNNQNEYSLNLSGDRTINNVASVNGIIYIRYNNNNFAQYNLSNKKLTEMSEFPEQSIIFSMCAGSQNILWIGSDGQGVKGLYEQSSPFKTFKTDAAVRCFAEENDTLLWIGTKGEGIKLLNKENNTVKKTITQANGLESNSVYALSKNRYGDIFVGSDGRGINIISRQHTVHKLIIPIGMAIPQNVYSILSDSDTLLWVGTSTTGFYKISIDKKEDSYIAKEVTHFYAQNVPGAINNNTIYSIEKDKSNNDILWIGTRGGGVNIFEISSNKFKTLESLGKNTSLSSNDILCLSNDKDNNLWIGTSYGLNRFITKEPYINTDYSDREEFVNNTIHGMLEDSHRNIWLSTNHGILYLDKQTDKIVHYTINNGLHSNEFTDGAFYIGKDSTFYFGGVNGFSYFDVNNIHYRFYSPKISLYNMQINNINQNINERINNNTLHLSYDEPYLSLTFIASDFINNANCEYSYRIKGFADKWISNGKQPNIMLTKLSPGKYELEVKCTNGDGIWGDNIYKLNLYVDYPWWRSNVAYFTYFIIILGIAYLAISIIRNRMKLSNQILLERMEKEHEQHIHDSKLNFFTNVAHEFFTPLTLICAPSQLLLERAGTDALSKRYLRIIKNNADRMQKLISELMEFRKVESGYVAIHPEEVDVEQMIAYIADNYVEISRLNNIELDIHTDLISEFITDKISLEKILFNLISNAFKYTPSGKNISIYTKQDKGNNTLIFSIRNGGTGLTNKQMMDIFDRFKIFESPKAQNSSSNGIGLNLTKNLVELLGGTISVDSDESEFVEFNVILPSLKPSEAIKDKSLSSNVADKNTKTYDFNLSERKKEISILIVEDEKDIRELLRDILSPQYNVREAEDGLLGLIEVEKNMPDLIISDILMPNMDGINFIEKLKAETKTAHIPVISISAKNTIEDHINAFKHGANLYIEKPFSPYHVLTSVENILERFSVLQQYFNSNRSAVKVKGGIELHNEDEKFVQDIIMFVENNIDNELLNPIAVSDHLNISKTTFYDRLKKTTGKTPSEFIKTIRLEYASKLLKNTQLTTSEIIFKSGFSSRSYFYREFAKQFNMSPNEYRKLE